MPEFKLVDEAGTSLTNISLNGGDWKPGDRIHRGRDTLEVLEVREGEEVPVLVVRSGEVSRSD